MRCAPALLAILALTAPVGCAAGRVEGDDRQGRLGFGGPHLVGDTATPGDSGSPSDSGGADGADSGGPDDTALPTGDTGSGDGSDGGDSGGSDSGAGDGADSGSGDTGAPVDTGEEPEPCLGITSISPVEASVVSTDTYEEVVVTLTGCATGIFVGDGVLETMGGRYYITWNEPEAVDTSAEATLIWEGAAAYPAESELYFTFTSDQGDFGPFTLKIRPS